MRRTILLLAGVALLLVSVDAGAEGIRPSSDTASASKQHERTITAELRVGSGYLKGALIVAGKLRGGPDACEEHQLVRFQRLVSGRWRAKARTLTGRGSPEDWVGVTPNGYWTRVGPPKDKHPNGSEWRVVAPESTLANGDVCLRAVSPVMEHHRQS